jgi:hypothetical protein
MEASAYLVPGYCGPTHETPQISIKARMDATGKVADRVLMLIRYYLSFYFSLVLSILSKIR